MTQKEKDLLYDLLTKKVLCGLDDDEQAQLDRFDPQMVAAEFQSLEMAAASISLASIEIEPMPEHLAESIAASYYAASPAIEPVADNDGVAEAPIFTADDVFAPRPQRSVMSWLGWAVAVVAIAALGFNLYTTRFNKQPEQANLPPADAPRTLTPAEQRDELLRSAPDVISATWAPGNVKDMKVTGDIVWSDAKQQGYMRFRNLPTNDANKTCYQLWIFDKSQDEATPIDGGIFDVASNGEIVVPINAKLTAVKPAMFAITLERHGGVVVSKREKIAALAKIETPSA